MKLNKLVFFTGLMFSFLLCSNVKALAEHDGAEDKGWMKEKWEQKKAEMHKKLGITPEQEEKLSAQREAHHNQMEVIVKEIKTKKEELQAELQKADFDEGKVKAIHSELKSLKAKMEDARLEKILEVRKVLTSEQFTQFMQMKEDWKGKKGRHHKKDKADHDMDKE